MTKWIVQVCIPYEGIDERDFDNAAEVVEYLGKSSRSLRSDLTVLPAPAITYEPHEFEEAFAKGEVE